ncbi:MAG: hypothetical protein QNK05_21810 [Myxococcota bacterium]|nr:hypothetical protein [Myxococcota bacterium]
MSGSSSSLVEAIRRRHLVIGWWALTGFALLGIGLEALHGFKAHWYLDPGFETRRLLWRLAHAHGALLSLVQIAFAATLASAGKKGGEGLRLTSTLFLLAGLLLPLGFFLGGVTIHGGDPGPGIALAPVGAACMLVAAGRTAWALTRDRGDGDD